MTEDQAKYEAGVIADFANMGKVVPIPTRKPIPSLDQQDMDSEAQAIKYYEEAVTHLVQARAKLRMAELHSCLRADRLNDLQGAIHDALLNVTAWEEEMALAHGAGLK